MLMSVHLFSTIQTQSSIKACVLNTISLSLIFLYLYKRFHRSLVSSVIMKAITFAVIAVVICAIAAFPQQKEGQAFSREAINQAINTALIPKDATIQNVQESQQLVAYESIPGEQRINLFEILGEHVPAEVINNLQGQIDQVGRN